MAHPGHNTAHGFDNGPPPPYSGYNTRSQPCMPAYIQPPSYPGYNAQYQHGMPAYFQQPMAHFPSMPGAYPQSYPPFPPALGFPGSYTHPAIPPLTDAGFPGINLKNHQGGIGLPPGYNYIYPDEHTIIHVLTTDTKPWNAGTTLNTIDSTAHTKFYVPVNMNIKEFMKKIGCVDPDEKKNVVVECSEKGGGRWAAGIRISMDDKDKMKKTVGEWGWRQNRNGNINCGGDPVVWLWRSKGS